MPWVPELFSEPALERFEEATHEPARNVRFFAGLLAGELDALIGSFSGEPELHLPIRGRVKGERAFTQYVADVTEWFQRRSAAVEPVALTLVKERGCEEAVLRLDTERGRVGLPVAILSDHPDGTQLHELRMYFSSWQVMGRHHQRPPLLQRDPALRVDGVVASYQQALAAGDVDGVLATLEGDAYAREPAGEEYLHSGHEDLRAFYSSLFSNGGGIPLDHCAALDDGATCAVEYNVTRWGSSELPPQAGVAVYVRGERGKLAAARIYDDVDVPVER